MKLQPIVKELPLKIKKNLMKLSPFFPPNFLKKAADLYNDIYKHNKFTFCS